MCRFEPKKQMPQGRNKLKLGFAMSGASKEWLLGSDGFFQ